MRAHEFIDQRLNEQSSGYKIYYHVSPIENRDSILRAGLKPMNKRYTDIVRKPGIYLWTEFELATDWVLSMFNHYHEDSDVWQIELPNSYELVLDTNQILRTVNAMVTYQPIPPKYLRLIPNIDVKADIFRRHLKEI